MNLSGYAKKASPVLESHGVTSATSASFSVTFLVLWLAASCHAGMLARDGGRYVDEEAEDDLKGTRLGDVDLDKLLSSEYTEFGDADPETAPGRTGFVRSRFVRSCFRDRTSVWIS